MLGKRNPQQPLFYYFNMADVIPKNHILRLINKYVDFSFIRSKVKHLYSDMGRPSIDPEVLIRMLLIGYLYGITSERKLCEEVRMHIGYRWFVGLQLVEKLRCILSLPNLFSSLARCFACCQRVRKRSSFDMTTF